jgi:shikimate kinase
MNKKNIVLIGLMGAGKTTIGKMLSQKLETE